MKQRRFENWEFLLSYESEGAYFFLLYPFREELEKIFLSFKRSLCLIPNELRDEDIRELVIRELYSVIHRPILRPLIWEFHLANKRFDDKLKFSAFLEKLACIEELSIFFRKYSVLFEIFNNLINNYLKAIDEFIGRFSDDFEEVASLVGFDAQEMVFGKYKSVGDSHCLGRRTLRIQVRKNRTSSYSKYVIYKPRPVCIDYFFQSFIRDFNTSKQDKVLKEVKIIDKEQYGWIEFVEHLPLIRGNEWKFYFQVGVLLAFVYSLNGQDLHFENLIAHGEHPVFIDLECLFSIPINDEQNENTLWPSVCETLVIPNKIKDNVPGYDFSALLFHDNQVSPNEKFVMKFVNENKVNLERIRNRISPKKNCIYYVDKVNFEISPLQYKNFILDGFKDGYEFLMCEKHKYIGLLRSIPSTYRKRVILRATFIYDKLAMESYHPKLLVSKPTYFAFIDQINFDRNRPMYVQIFNSEKEDIFQGDVPYFYSDITCKLLFDSRGNNITYDYDQSPLERVILKFKSLGKIDLDNQMNLISTTLQENYGKF